MKNNNLSLSVILFASILIGSFSFNLVFAEIDTDKSVYSKGELVNISGSVDLQNDQKINIVEIEIVNSDDDDVVVNEYAPTNDDDKFSRSYETNTWIVGDYTLTVSYNDVEESVEFEISDSSPSDDEDNPSSNSSESDTVQQESSTTPSNTILDPPVDLDADVVSSTQIHLSWSNSNDDDISIIGYKIEARTNTDPNYSIIVENTNNVDTSYSHTGLIPDTVYAYRVSAISFTGESEPSSSTTVKTSKVTSAPNTSLEDTNVPTDVVAKIISPTSVELVWSPPTQTYGQTIQDYTIKQELSSGAYDEIASTVNANTKYLISNLSTDETYTFVVIANYLRGSSDASEKTIVTLASSFNTNSNDDESGNSDQDSSSESTDNSSYVAPDGIPDPPVELKVKPVSSTQIDLLWSAPENASDNNTAIVGYGIEFRTVDNSSYSTVIDDTENTDTAYSHTGLIPNTTYIYRVFAINGMGTSEPSSENLANTLISDTEDGDENNIKQQENESAPTQDDNSIDDSDISSLPTITPGTPVDLTAIPISQNRINLSWSAPIDNDDTSTLLGYMIESKTSNESDYAVLVTNTGSASTTTYSHTGLTAGLTYNYRIYAINSFGEGSASDMAEATIVISDQQTGSEEQSSLTSQPLQITLNTDKPVYNPDDPIKISGTINDSTQNMLLGIRVISSDGTIVYVRSVSIDNDNLFETVIAPVQRQSSVWSGNAEFTVEVTYNGRVQTTTTFETENSGTIIENGSSSPNQPETESNDQQQSLPLSSSSESTTGIVSNDEFETLKNQNTALQSANQQLQDENNQLKIQIDELNKKIDQLNIVIMEQVRVMMETINTLKSGN